MWMDVDYAKDGEEMETEVGRDDDRIVGEDDMMEECAHVTKVEAAVETAAGDVVNDVPSTNVAGDLCMESSISMEDQLEMKAVQYCEMRRESGWQPMKRPWSTLNVVRREVTPEVFDAHWGDVVANKAAKSPFVANHSGHWYNVLMSGDVDVAGIYFFVPNEKLIKSSPYGSERIELPAHEVLNPEKYKWYFVDFHKPDNSSTETRYITLAIVPVEQMEVHDEFRRRGVAPLNPVNNEWLRYIKVATGPGVFKHFYKVNTTRALCIYAFCTFGVDLANVVHTSGVACVPNAGGRTVYADQYDEWTNS